MNLYDRMITIYIDLFVKSVNDKAWNELLMLCEKKDIVSKKG